MIDSFNADKPYDQFLREQIAGDILANQKPSDRYAEQVTATGYLAISRRFGFDSENYHHLTIQDTIDTLGQSVMGLSLGCCRCHDHKFDALTAVDYYGLYGIFDSSRYSFPGSEQKQKFRSMVPLLPPSEAIPKWRAFDREVAAIATSLETRKQPVTPAILRSLNDMDGDFEMQAPAAVEAMAFSFRRGFMKVELPSRMRRKVRSEIFTPAAESAPALAAMQGRIALLSHFIRIETHPTVIAFM